MPRCVYVIVTDTLEAQKLTTEDYGNNLKTDSLVTRLLNLPISGTENRNGKHKLHLEAETNTWVSLFQIWTNFPFYCSGGKG